MTYMWIGSFQYEGPGDWTEVSKFDCKHHYQLSYPSTSKLYRLSKNIIILLNLYLCKGIHAFMCVCRWSCMWRCVLCAHECSQKSTLGFTYHEFYCCHFVFYFIVLFYMHFILRSKMLVASKPHRPFCLHTRVITSFSHHARHFYVDVRDWTWVPIFPVQALY